METHLKFKKSWYDILDRCSRGLRNDVIEAVFQYFFAGAEPAFDDDARSIAFGFIRAEIDETRRRARARSERRLHQQPDAPAQTVEAPDENEANYLRSLALHWNNTLVPLGADPVDISMPLSSSIHAPALASLRKLGYKKLYDLISNARAKPGHTVAKADFTRFFTRIWKDFS